MLLGSLVDLRSVRDYALVQAFVRSVLGGLAGRSFGGDSGLHSSKLRWAFETLGCLCRFSIMDGLIWHTSRRLQN